MTGRDDRFLPLLPARYTIADVERCIAELEEHFGVLTEDVARARYTNGLKGDRPAGWPVPAFTEAVWMSYAAEVVRASARSSA